MLEIVLDEEVVSVESGDPDVIHLFCPHCYPEGDISHCGLYIADEELLPPCGDDGTPDDCALCWAAWEVHICPA